MAGRTVDSVTRSIEQMQFNTAIAALMALVGQLLRHDQPPAREVRRVLVSLLAPFAPDVSEELWRDHVGEPGSVHASPWPRGD